MVRCGVWFGAVRCDVMWCCVMWYGAVRCAVVLHVWCDLVWCCMCGVVLHVWCDLVWCCMCGVVLHVLFFVVLRRILVVLWFVSFNFRETRSVSTQ